MQNTKKNKEPLQNTVKKVAATDISAPLYPIDIKNFQRTVNDFYRKNKRTFPWREDITPYRVLISEVMLQQTQVERVRAKYLFFLSLFPGFSSLAVAPLKKVVEAWQGLGYNRRALSLKKLSETVMERYGGELPADRTELLTLRGVGEATAGAVLAFAFNTPVVFIETNIRRVFIHHFFDGEETVSDRHIAPLVEAALDGTNPRDWYYALMDYGSMLGKVVANPNRRSTHYIRQLPFEGSDRKLRGDIIRILIKADAATVDDISKSIGEKRKRAAALLSSMIREGLVTEDSGRYMID